MSDRDTAQQPDLPNVELGSEEWRPVEGWPYEVSNWGRVRRRGADKVMVLHASGKGYPQVDMYNNGRRKILTVHRLVARAFIGPSRDGMQIDHINDNKWDNRPENLEWVTLAENMRRARESGLSDTRGSRNSQAKLTERDIPVIRAMRRLGWSYPRIGRVFSVNPEAIGRIIRGVRWAHVK